MQVDEIVMYLRKSRADSDNETVEEVVAKHEVILQEYALTAFGHIIPPENIYKEVASGDTIDSRPEIQRVLALLAHNHKYKALLCVEPQRLTRGDMMDCGTIIRVLRYNNIQVITPSKNFDLTDQYDLKYFQMTLQQGNEYLEYIKFILNRGRLASVKEGCFIGQSAPYGYRKVTNADKKFTLEPDEHADVVRLMFDLYVNKDLGCNQIASELDRRAIKPLHSQYWNAASIRGMLQNPVYIGKIRWNNRKTVINTDEHGNTLVSRPRNSQEVMIVDGLHEALIDEALFNAAQAKTGRNARLPGAREIRNPYATLLKCGTCGHSMSMRVYKNKDGGERSSPRMLCTHQVHCHTPSVEYGAFERALLVSLRRHLSDFRLKLETDSGKSSKTQEAVLRSMRQELESVQKRQDKLYDFLERGIYSEEVFLERNTALMQQRSRLSAAIAKQEQELPQIINYEDRIYQLTHAIEIIQSTSVSAAHKNAYLKSFIDRIEYTNELTGRGNRFTENKFSVEVFFL